MADDKTTANKSDEDKAAQNDPKNPASQQSAKVDHGEPSKAAKAEAEAQEKVKQDPWGTTPMQMRDQHDELVDPEKNDPISTGLVGDQLRGQTRVDPMEPQSDDKLAEQHGISGGTNAPA